MPISLRQNFVDYVAAHYAGSLYLDDVHKGRVAQVLAQQYTVSDFQELGWTLWEGLEAHYVGTLQQRGVGVLWGEGTIHLQHAGLARNEALYPLGLLLSQIQAATPILDIQMDQREHTVFPGVSMLRRMQLSAQWVIGEIPRDDIVDLHRQDLAPIGLPLTTLLLGDIGEDVHPFIYALHDLYHGFRFARLTPNQRRYFEAIYDAASVVSGDILRSTWGAAIRHVVVDLDSEDAQDIHNRTHYQIARIGGRRAPEDLKFLEGFYFQLALRDWPTEFQHQVDALKASITAVLPQSTIQNTVATGVYPFMDLVRSVEHVLETGFIRDLRATPGVKAVEVDHDNGRISIFYREPFQNSMTGSPEMGLSRQHPLYAPYRIATVLNLILGIHASDIVDAAQGILHLPTAERMRNFVETKYAHQLPEFQYVARELSRDELHQAHTRNTAVLGLRLTDRLFLGDLGGNVHSWIYYMHDWYHAVAFAIFRPQDRHLATQMYEAVAAAAAQHQDKRLTDQMQNTLVDMESPYLGVEGLLNRTLLPLQWEIRAQPATDVYIRLLEIQNAALTERLQRIRPPAWLRGK